MRIVFAISSFGHGGAERQLALLSAELDQRGHEVHIIHLKGGPNLAYLKDSNIIFHEIKTSSNYSLMIGYKSFKIIRSLRPDIVQTWLLQMDIFVGFAAILNRSPLILSERSSGRAYRGSYKFILRILVGYFSKFIISNSKGGMAYWQKYFPEKKLALVRNSITPLTDFECSLSRMVNKFLNGRKFIICASRFESVKNILVLIDSIILTAKNQSEIVFLLFGEGVMKESIINKISNSGLSSKILVAGYSTQLDFWLKRAVAFISLSHFEGHPNSVLEAALAKCPLVLSDIPAHREIFNTQSAYFVPRNSPEIVAKTIENLIIDKHGANIRASEAYKIVSQFSIQTAANNYISIYRLIINKFNKNLQN